MLNFSTYIKSYPICLTRNALLKGNYKLDGKFSKSLHLAMSPFLL